MNKSLFVVFGSDPVGKISFDEERRWIFQYDPIWLKNDRAIPLSVRLPLQSNPFSPDFAKPFFANLLPEGELRRLIAAKHKISVTNDFELLAALGGECAGAFSVSSEKGETSGKGKYREISKKELEKLVREMPKVPLLTADKKARLSLAGAQSKLPIYYKNEKIFFPEEGAPSSHILKPPIPNVEDSVANEAFCMKLASALGLDVPENKVIFFQKIPIYLIERYDRQEIPPAFLQRLHQEDFCQALGNFPDQKYQNEGGPSFQECFQVLDQYSLQPALDKKAFIACAVFNFLIGNSDAHAKNFSLLISKEGVRLAPFYDLMSTRVYEGLSDRLAMKIGNKYESDLVQERHWETFSEEAGVKPRIVWDILKKFSRELPPLAKKEMPSFSQKFGGEKILKKIVLGIQKNAQRFL